VGDYHVTIYTSPDCEKCAEAKRFLESRGINFEEKNITDPGARGELLEKTGRPDCPTVDINGNIVVGFLQEKWDHLLPG